MNIRKTIEIDFDFAINNESTDIQRKNLVIIVGCFELKNKVEMMKRLKRELRLSTIEKMNHKIKFKTKSILSNKKS
jgi:hypothetical protein